MARTSIGSVFGWTGSPIYQGLADNRNALMNFGAGLASGNSWSDGLSRGIGAVPQGAAQDDAWAQVQAEKAKQQETLNQTTEWLRANGQDALYQAVQSGAMDPGQAFQMAISQQQSASQGVKPIEINGQLVDPKTGAVIGDYRNPNDVNGAISVTYGTTPVWGVDPETGQTVYGVNGSDGSFKRVDTGGIQPMGPGDVAGARAAGTIDGKTQANAQAALPAAQNTVSQTLETINALRNDSSGQSETFGRSAFGTIPNQWVPTTPGTPKADFQVMLDQAQGQAFLQAREMLRGGGQITDYEGQRAENAIARLSTAQSQKAFNDALNDFQRAVEDGYAKIELAARGQSAPLMNTPSSSQSTSDNDPLGIRGR